MKVSSKTKLVVASFGLLYLHTACQPAQPIATSAGTDEASAQATASSETTAVGPVADPVFEGLHYRYTVKKAKLPGGVNVAYTDEGKGPETLIFIHGLGSYSPAWNKNVSELSQHYRCIAIDLPGYGKSDKAGITAGMASYASQVLALMDALQLKQVTLVGHSMGGQIALTAALQAPQRIKYLILAAPAGIETFTEQQKQLFKMTVTPESVQKTTPEQVVANFKVNFHQMPADAQYMVDDRLKMTESAAFGDYSAAVAGSVAAMVDEPVYEQLPQVQVPTLIIFGAQDALIPNRYLNPNLTTQAVAETARDRIPNSKLVVLPEAGHFLQYEQANAFNQAIRDFLK
ncbi:alpha/beta fold hydrolase [Pontibacter ramchanderi]|uniref:Pimeloyl-ACP methyl ester carboxylesterase n=1 Tax=Pontibacter ramchanderi TaxID=1179743 RepID=A0A2N3UD71_9BACT|nr:alpha/beta hydrolase [Pontibacter ramchanderi]PKV67328.1 pimeloyl-ACP methyl ester carboxylesterase [Pontibacter ramchanderi]